ncbi:MAG: hypothetical protein ABL903_05965 [Methylococcales bacterium]
MQILQSLQKILLGTVIFLTGALATSSVAELGEAKQHLAGKKDCQFFSPAEWGDSLVTWHGQCQGGKAHGLGVLRAYRKEANTLLFLGTLEQGELSLGVIDGVEGYIAGQFAQGKLLPEVERNVIISAFRNASAAAKAYSQRLKQSGNVRSAEFYLKKAQELERQMD